MGLHGSLQRKEKSPDGRDSLQNGRKIFASYTTDKGLIIRMYRMYRELEKLTSQRINNPLNKWAN
jgi:hypothetical protein